MCNDFGGGGYLLVMVIAVLVWNRCDGIDSDVDSNLNKIRDLDERIHMMEKNRAHMVSTLLDEVGAVKAQMADLLDGDMQASLSRIRLADNVNLLAEWVQQLQDAISESFASIALVEKDAAIAAAFVKQYLPIDKKAKKAK